jgi:protein-tyrosine-phosphatase/predicted ATP-grasp superfamily ATP-dependent carboligase
MRNEIKQALVLDSHCRAAVESIQALGRSGIAVDAASAQEDCLGFHSQYVRNKITIDDEDNFKNWIHALDSRNGYDLIVPSTELSLLQLMQLDPADPTRVKSVLPANESLQIALDKQETHQLAARLQIPLASSRLITYATHVGEAAHYPVVLKPVRSKARVDGIVKTLGVVIATDPVTRRETLEQWLPYFPVQEQQYFSGNGVGIEFLFSKGKKVWHFAHERIHEYPLTGGAGSYRRSIVAPAALLDAAETLMRELNWHGVAMVEFKCKCNGEFILLEINPRLWGSLALAIDAGVNFPLGLYQVATSAPLSPQPEYKVGYYSRDLATDLDWLKENLRADSKNPLLLVRPKITSLFEYLRPLIGKESWDHFDFRDLGMTAAIMRKIVSRYVSILTGAVKRKAVLRKLNRHHETLKRKWQAADGEPRKLLFLCYGNICRSPVAERFAKASLPGFEIRSAGLHEKENRRSPTALTEYSAKKGIDLSKAASRCVSKEDVDRADLILLMDAENHEVFAKRFPEAVDRMMMLGLFAREPRIEIADPYNRPADEIYAVIDQIQSSVEGLVKWIDNLHANSPHADKKERISEVTPVG